MDAVERGTRSWILAGPTPPRIRPFDIRLMPKINNNYFIIKRPRLAGSKYTSTRRNTSSQPDTARCSSFIRRGTGIDQGESREKLSLFRSPAVRDSMNRRSGATRKFFVKSRYSKSIKKQVKRWRKICEKKRICSLIIRRESIVTRFVNSRVSVHDSRMLGFLPRPYPPLAPVSRSARVK